jgi:hypothetical protein
VTESFEFASAVREKCYVVIALAGPTGGGKTWSALELAAGLGGTTALVSSEGRRDLYYADDFKFDRAPISPPFTPENWLAAIDAAASRYSTVICDNFSDEYTGEGGLCDMADAEAIAFAKRHKGREMNTASRWARPKAQHKKIVNYIRNRAQCHLIFCLRAEEKVRLVKVRNERGHEETKVEPIGYQPICEKNFMFDMMESALLLPEKRDKEGKIVLADARGVPQWIKPMSKHLQFFPTDKPITRECGRLLAEWCAGGAPAGTPLSGSADMGLEKRARAIAEHGYTALEVFCGSLSKEQRLSIKALVINELQDIARLADDRRREAQDEHVPDEEEAGDDPGRYLGA